MKRDSYEELMDKFYAGTASVVEIDLLVAQGLIDEGDRYYAKALREEKGRKLNLDFEDFTKNMPKTQVIALPERRNWKKKLLIAAATVAAIMTGYMFWPQQQPKKELVIDQRIQLTVPNNKDEIVATQPTEPTVKTPERKNKKIRHAIQQIKDKKESKIFLVIVNGKPITNEKMAIDITRESLVIVSKKLTSITDLNPYREE